MAGEPSKDEIARAIRLRNGGMSSRASETPSLTAEEADAIVRRLSFSGAESVPEEAPEPEAAPAAAPERAANGSAAEEKPADAMKVQIVLRIRPEEPTTAKSTASDCFRVVSESTLVAQPPPFSQAYRSTGTATSFHFSRIFQAQTAQRELFEATTRPVLDAAWEGQSGLVFAYGVTNSGKTYTISGTSDAPGVLPQALQHVMAELPRRQQHDAQPVTRVTASYLEIYNENVFDLLSPALHKRRALRLQDCDGQIQVRGAVERPIRSLSEGLELLQTGRRHKQVAETACNSDSSRSHCVFTLHLYRKASRGATELLSKVSIVDLAGSERSARTGASGLRMQEASKINGSLMNLMRCLETLRWNQQHPPSLQRLVPFRESKLTRLFQENLVGAQTGPLVMVVAMSPASHEFDETLRTLKYSAIARELVRTRTSLPRLAAASSASFYDLDGRLKKRKRVSLEPAPEAAQSSMKKAPLSASKRRRSRSATKSKPHTSEAGQLKHRKTTEDAVTVVKPTTAEMGTSPMETQKDVAQRELRWAKLELENEELRCELAREKEEKQQLEVRLRAEIGNVMVEQVQQIREQYQSMAKRQRAPEDLPSARKKRERMHAEESERLRAQAQELREKVRECEDEIQRIHKRHQAELEKLQKLQSVAPDDENSTPSRPVSASPRRKRRPRARH